MTRLLFDRPYQGGIGKTTSGYPVPSIKRPAFLEAGRTD